MFVTPITPNIPGFKWTAGSFRCQLEMGAIEFKELRLSGIQNVLTLSLRQWPLLRRKIRYISPRLHSSICVFSILTGDNIVISI
jgi:hypothetical protein